MSEELDRRAAKAMGWTFVKSKDGLDDWYDDGDDGIVFVNRWSPSTDHNDLAELLKEVARQGLEFDLDRVFEFPSIADTFAIDVSKLCEAACKVLEEA